MGVMLALRTESYKERYAQNYGEFMFDANLESGAPYCLAEMQKSINNMEGHIASISNDIKEIIDTYGISDKYPKELNNTIDKINWSYDVLKGTLEQILDTMEDHLESLRNQSQISLEQIVTINDKLGLTTQEVEESAANKSVLATVGTGALSLIEGFGNFGQDLWNAGEVAGTVLWTPVTGLVDGGAYLITGGKWDSLTKSMWGDTLDHISTNENKWMWDSAYDNELSGLKDSTYNFDTTRSVGNGIGYAAPSIAIGIASGGATVAASSAGASAGAAASSGGVVAAFSAGSKTAAVVSGIAGFGHGTSEAAASGASVGKVLTYGGAYGAWNAGQMLLGGKISGLNPFKGKLANVGLRVLLDTADSGLEGIVNPGLEMIYKDGTYDQNGNYREFTENDGIVSRYSQIFNEDGGWKNVGTQAAIGGIFSAGGEAFDGIAKSVHAKNFESNLDFYSDAMMRNRSVDDISSFLKKYPPSEQEAIINRAFKNLDNTSDLKNMLNSISSMDKVNVNNLELENIIDKIGLREFNSLDDSTKALLRQNPNVASTLDRLAELNKFEVGERSVADGLTGKATAKDYAKKFSEMSVDEQLKDLKKLSSDYLVGIYGSPDVSTEVKSAALDYLLKQQDAMAHSAWDFARTDVGLLKESPVLSNKEFVSQLTDENLVKFFSSEYHTKELYDEVMRRFDNPKMFSAFQNYTPMFFPKELNTITSFYNNLSAYDPASAEMLVDVIKDAQRTVSPIIKTDGMKNSKIVSIYAMLNGGDLDTNLLAKLNAANDINRTTFNYKALDKQLVTDFGDDFMLKIGKFEDLTDKLYTLKENHPQSYEHLKRIYANALKDNSLNTTDLITKQSINYLFEESFIFDNIREIDESNVMDYILRKKYSGISEKVSFSDKYYDDIASYCDKKFEDEYKFATITGGKYLDEMKSTLLNKYYSMDIRHARSLLDTYGSHMNELLGTRGIDGIEREVQFLKDLDDIVNLDNPEAIKQIYDSQVMRVNPEEIASIDNNLKQAYFRTFEESLSASNYSLSNRSYRTEMYDGKEVKIIPVDDDFTMLVHSSDTGYKGRKELINDSYVETYNQLLDTKTSGLATSLISNENIGCAPVGGSGVLYGYTNVSADNIRNMGVADINSHIAEYNAGGTGNKEYYMPADSLGRNSTRVYNEVVVDRNNVKPDYVVVFSDMDETIKQNSIKSAADWGIPIVEVDVAKLAQNNLNKINQSISSFNSTRNVNDLVEAIDLYESNVSGFKLNVDESVKMTVNATADAGHASMAGLFDSTEIEGSITRYIDEIKQSNNTEAIAQLRDIMQKKVNNYKISNADYGPVEKTVSGIDYEKLLKMLGD